MQDEVRNHCPAWHYVIVDDILGIQAAMKWIWGGRLTIARPRQGRYKLDSKTIDTYPLPGLTIEGIGDVIN